MARQPVIGVLQVSCRQCRALAGRPCVDARGYLAEHAHGRRLLDWRELEAAETRDIRRNTIPAEVTTAPAG